MIFYHIDRSNELKVGQILNLQSDSNFYQDIKDKYPDGLSHHGLLYYLKLADTSAFTPNDYAAFHSECIKEEVLENERLTNFPNKASRFQSLFTVKSYKHISNWINNYQSFKDYNIFEINSNDYKDEYDIKWIDKIIDHSPTSYVYANNYWSGKHSDSPLLEVLIKLPVTIGKKVEFCL